MELVVIVALVILQRIVELRIADRNTQALLKTGGVEFGKNHYWMLVTLHTCFFLSLFIESCIRGSELSENWIAILSVFILAQAARIWIIQSMGGRWTTRIIVVPEKPRLKTGPFRFISHPNYTIVAVELLTLPLLFDLYVTAILFTAVNAFILLAIRIPEENRALQWAQDSSRA